MVAHTLLSHLEQLVGIPTYKTAWQSTPAPFQNTNDDLNNMLIRNWLTSAFGSRKTYHWLRHPQLLQKELTTQTLIIEEMTNKSAYAAGIRSRAEWQEEKGEIESYGRPSN